MEGLVPRSLPQLLQEFFRDFGDLTVIHIHGCVHFSHARIGERLEALYGKALSEIAAELAHHFEEGLDWPRAATYLQLSADTAGRRYAHREATAILRHALALTRKLPDPQRAARHGSVCQLSTPRHHRERGSTRRH